MFSVQQSHGVLYKITPENLFTVKFNNYLIPGQSMHNYKQYDTADLLEFQHHDDSK